MSTAGKRLVLVLGMHRSGTSTLTRALEVLGVDLGSHLLPPAPGDNEKGYFEDAPIHELNRVLLLELGHDWHTLTPVNAKELAGDVAARHAGAARELLRARFASTGCFGLKDPRINRLLPFWQPIFAELGLTVSYLVCSRNPLSVARSLVRRDGFDPVKVHYLWLEHTVDALARTAGADRVVVDYDVFLDDPRAQLARLADRLGLPFDPEGPAFAGFRRDFLVESMRHTRFTQADLEADAGVPPGVARLFAALAAMAADRLPANGAALEPLLADLGRFRGDLAPALSYMRRFEESSRNFQLAHADAESRAATYVATVRERDAAIAGLVPAVQERDARIADLAEALGGSQAQGAVLGEKAAGLERTVAALQETIAAMRASLAAFESQVAGLSAEIAGRDRDIADRDRGIAERDARHGAMLEAARRLEARNAELEKGLEEARAQLARTQAELADLLAGTWQIPRPGRIVRMLRAKRTDE